MRWRPRSGRRLGRLLIIARLAMAARYDTALSRKQSGTPTTAIRTPAIEGPMTAAEFQIEELSAIAFIRSSRPTISIANACRVGTSTTGIMPQTNAQASTIAYVAVWVNVAANRTSAGTMNAVWVTWR